MKHGQFDPQSWILAYGQEADSDAIAIGGPNSACANIVRRDEFLKGRAPVDITHTSQAFVWNVGEPDERYLTKIGGLPFLPKEYPWPERSSGNPQPFIGQLSFVDSMDVLPCRLPGDVLLFFGPMDDPESWQPVWMPLSASSQPLVTWRDVATASDQLPLFGDIWEVGVNDQWQFQFWPDEDGGGPELDEEKACLFQLWATQICEAPFSFGRRIHLDRDSGECVIGSFAPIGAEEFVPGQFSNCPGPFHASYSSIGLVDIFCPGYGDGESVVVTFCPAAERVCCIPVRP